MRKAGQRGPKAVLSPCAKLSVPFLSQGWAGQVIGTPSSGDWGVIRTACGQKTHIWPSSLHPTALGPGGWPLSSLMEALEMGPATHLAAGDTKSR